MKGVYSLRFNSHVIVEIPNFHTNRFIPIALQCTLPNLVNGWRYRDDVDKTTISQIVAQREQEDKLNAEIVCDVWWWSTMNPNFIQKTTNLNNDRITFDLLLPRLPFETSKIIVSSSTLSEQCLMINDFDDELEEELYPIVDGHIKIKPIFHEIHLFNKSMIKAREKLPETCFVKAFSTKEEGVNDN